jgi:hypothetical protein
MPTEASRYQTDAAAKDVAIVELTHEAAALETTASPRNHRFYLMALASVIGGVAWARRGRRTADRNVCSAGRRPAASGIGILLRASGTPRIASALSEQE